MLLQKVTVKGSCREQPTKTREDIVFMGIVVWDSGVVNLSCSRHNLLVRIEVHWTEEQCVIAYLHLRRFEGLKRTASLFEALFRGRSTIFDFFACVFLKLYFMLPN